MSWAFQPLLPGAAHQQSDPNAVSISEAASAADSCDAVVYKLYSDSVTEAAGGLIDAGKGYAAGGQNSGGELSSVECINFSSGAVSTIGATISARSDISGLESATRGYGAGGWAGGGPVAEIDGIIFANEAYNNPSAALSLARFFHTGTRSDTNGYWLAGNDNSTGYVADIDGIVFSSEAANNPAAALGLATDSPAGVSSSTIGYACSGNANATEVQGVTFSSEAAHNPSASLARSQISAAGAQSSTVGYFMGDQFNTANSKLTFSGETSANITATLSQIRCYLEGCESTTQGYAIGGSNGSGTYWGSIDKLSFSGETVSANSASLTTVRNTHGAFTYAASSYSISEASDGEITSGQSAAIVETATSADSPAISGWGTTAAITQAASGTDSTDATTQNEQTTTQVAAATDSPAATYSTSAAEDEAASAGHSTTEQTVVAMSEPAYGAGGKGYFAGGVVYGGGNISDINRLTFSTHVAAVLSATLATARKNAGACASSANGYWVGGFTTTYSAQIDGIKFFDESARNPSMSISTTTDLAGTQSSVRGYIVGGYDGLPVSEVRTVNFFPESSGALGSTLPFGKFDMAAMASPSGAYFAGGKSGSTYYDVLHGMPFSSETVSTLSAVLGATKSRHAGMASPLCGYFTGGSNAGSPTTAIDRISFASEARTTLGATLSVARVQHAGCTSLERGYSAGGYDGGAFYSYSIESLIFSSETVSTTSAVLGNGSDGTVDLAGTQNLRGASDYSAVEWPVSQADAATATDTVITAGGTEVAAALEVVTATSTSDWSYTLSAAATEDNAQDLSKDGGAAYFGGGTGIGGGGVVSVAFSNEAVATNIATLDTSGIESSGASSETKGYFWGGQSRTAISTLVFSSLTSTTLSATTGTTQYGMASFSNADCGYFCGRNNSSADLIAALMFGSETARTLTATLPTGRGQGAGVKSATKGYVLGGYAATYSAEIDGLVFATEALVNPSAALSTARYGGGGVQSSTIGYCLGGEASGGTSAVVDGIRFSDEAAVNGANAMYEAAARGGSASSYSTGYLANPNVANATYCHKITFSSEATSTVGVGVLNRVSSCGVQKNLYAARGAFDEPRATSSEPVSVSEGASSAGTPAATYVTASAVTEAASGVDTNAATAVFVAADTEAGAATAEPSVTMVAVSAQQDTATATDAPVGLPTMPASRIEDATASDSHDAIIPGLAVAIEENATAIASHPAVALFISAISEAGSSTAAQVGGFLVNDPENASAADVNDATLTFTLVGTAPASAADAIEVIAGFVSAITQAASATDAQAAAMNLIADGADSGAATDSTNSSVTIVALEQTTAADSASASPLWGGRITEYSQATAVFNSTGPVSVSRTEPASAVDVPVGRPVWPVSGADAASATASQVSEFAFFITESGAAASDAAGVAEKDAAGVAQASAVDLPAVVRITFAEGYSVAYPVDAHDAALYFTLVSQAVEAASGAAAAGAVVTIGAHGSESATPGAEQQAIKLAAAGAIEAAFATDEALGGRVFSGYVLALAGAADYSDAFILDLLPPSIGMAVKIIRQGNTAYVIMAVDQRSISADRGDREILYRAEIARMVDVVSHERHIDETQQVRDILLPDDPRDLLSDE